MGNSDLIWANNEQSNCSYRAAYRNTSMAITPADCLQQDILGTVGSQKVHLNVFLWSHQAWIHADQQGQIMIIVGTGLKTCIGAKSEWNFSVSRSFFQVKVVEQKKPHFFSQNWVMKVCLSFTLLILPGPNCFLQPKPQPQAWILSVVLCFVKYINIMFVHVDV